MSTIAKKLSVLLLGILCASALQAQTVSGVVKDSSGEPVVGAFVVEQGTSNGVSTGIDGDFSILVKDASKAVLEVSMIGLSTAVVPVNGRAQLDVVLEEDATVLEETVVVGYATVKRRDLLRVIRKQRQTDRTASGERKPGPRRQDGRCLRGHHRRRP